MDALDTAAPAHAPSEHEARLRRPADRHCPAAPLRRLQSTDLFGPGAGPEIEIEHGDAVYRLRRTSLGKLILTK